MFSSHDLPIPNSFNEVAANALEYPWESAWFVEEDVVVPRGALREMQWLQADIAAVDYMLKTDPPTLSHRTIDDRVVFVALGCTLVRREVFEALDRPWFRDDKILIATRGGKPERWLLSLDDRPKEMKYGNQDVYFCVKALEAGFSIDIVPHLLADHVNLAAQ